MLKRLWSANGVKYENEIISAVKRNTFDLELQKGKTKIGKQGARSLYLFEITKRFRKFNKLLSDI